MFRILTSRRWSDAARHISFRFAATRSICRAPPDAEMGADDGASALYHRASISRVTGIFSPASRSICRQPGFCVTIYRRLGSGRFRYWRGRAEISINEPLTPPHLASRTFYLRSEAMYVKRTPHKEEIMLDTRIYFRLTADVIRMILLFSLGIRLGDCYRLDTMRNYAALITEFSADGAAKFRADCRCFAIREQTMRLSASVSPR